MDPDMTDDELAGIRRLVDAGNAGFIADEWWVKILARLDHSERALAQIAQGTWGDMEGRASLETAQRFAAAALGIDIGPQYRCSCGLINCANDPRVAKAR